MTELTCSVVNENVSVESVRLRPAQDDFGPGAGDFSVNPVRPDLDRQVSNDTSMMEIKKNSFFDLTLNVEE